MSISRLRDILSYITYMYFLVICQIVPFSVSDSIVQEVENLPAFYSALAPIQRYPTRLITLSKKFHSFSFAILNNSLTFVS